MKIRKIFSGHIPLPRPHHPAVFGQLTLCIWVIPDTWAGCI